MILTASDVHKTDEGSLDQRITPKSMLWPLRSYHALCPLSQLCSAGATVHNEVCLSVTALGQFAFIHRDPNLLSFASTRRPNRSEVTAAGCAPLDRELFAAAVAFATVVFLVILDLKLHEYND